MKGKPSRFRGIVEVNGAREVANSFRGMGGNAYHTERLMKVLVVKLEQESRKRVMSGDYFPLKENTVERKLAQGENPGVFRDESRPIAGVATRKPDALYEALTTPGAPGQIRYTTRTWALFGVESSGKERFFYARMVQNVKGTKRKILAISEETALSILEMTANYVLEGYIKPGLLSK